MEKSVAGDISPGIKPGASAGTEETNRSCRWPLLAPELDVRQPITTRWLVEHGIAAGGLFAMIYAAGRCPPGGFEVEYATPLSELPYERVAENFHLHAGGLFRFSQAVLPLLQTGGHIVSIKSLLHRLTDRQCPPWLHAGHVAMSNAAQDEVVKWLWRDPAIRERGVLVHRLAVGAVDTAFYAECGPEHRPQTLLPVEAVADEVMRAFNATTCLDRDFLPKQRDAISTVSLNRILAANVRRLLAQHRMSETQLARSIQMERSVLNRHLAGHRQTWTLDQLTAIADALQTTLADLLSPRTDPLMESATQPAVLPQHSF